MSDIPYLTPSESLALSNEFFRLHATFARPIAIFQTALQTVIATNPSNNFLFDNAPFNSTEQTIIQSGVFQARIWYARKENIAPFNSTQRSNGADQNMIRLEDGEVRVRLDATGAAMLNTCERVTFDGTIFDVQTNQRPHSLVGPPNFFDFYLKHIQ